MRVSLRASARGLLGGFAERCDAADLTTIRLARSGERTCNGLVQGAAETTLSPQVDQPVAI
jgi:hypothetical protein